MSARPLFALAAMAAVVHAAPLAAQPAVVPAPPAVVQIDDVLRLIDTVSPQVLAARAVVDVAAADRLTARALPNPTVSANGVRLASGLSTGATTQEQLSVDQPLLLFGQRSARTRLADAVTAVERARVDTDLAARHAAARLAFATLLARQETLRVLTESREDVARAERVVQGRAEAGERSQYDVVRITTEGQQLDVAIAEAATDVEDGARSLAELVGVPGWRPQAQGTLGPGSTATDGEALWAAARQVLPAILEAARRREAADAALGVSRADRRPIPSVSGGVLMTHDVAGTSAVIGLSVPVPLFDRNRGPIARATAALRVEHLNEEAAVADARTALDHALAVFVQRRETLERVERDLSTRLPTLRRMAEDAYREGRGDVLDWLDALRTARELRLQDLQARAAVVLAEQSLRAAAGLDLPTP